MSGKITGDVQLKARIYEHFAVNVISTTGRSAKSILLCTNPVLSPFLYSTATHKWEEPKHASMGNELMNEWMNAIQWIWLTSISSFIIIWGFRWTRVQELNGSHVVTWPTEVQLARTILLSLAPWIPTPIWGRINPCHLTSEAVPPIITQLTSTELSFGTTAGEDKATTPFLCRTVIGSHCQPRARSEICKCNWSYPNKNSSFLEIDARWSGV